MSDDSITQWIDAVKDGDEQAVERIWQRYFENLCRYASRKLAGNPRRMADEEDVAISAFNSFFRNARAGRCRIVSLLGEGGMGEVYRADDLTLGDTVKSIHTVALTFLPASLSDQGSLLPNFRTEVRLSRQITHPNVCRVYDIGEVAGTPAYMAPEQLLRGETSVRSDIYSLGLVLYEIFVGKPLHQKTSIDELRWFHEDATPVIEALEAVDDIDPVMKQVILRCLANPPDERPASVAEVSAALPLAARPAPTSRDSWKRNESGRHRRSPLLFVTVTLVCVAIVGSVLTWLVKTEPSTLKSPPALHAEIVIDESRPLWGGLGNAFDLSRDGRFLVYTTDWGSKMHLHTFSSIGHGRTLGVSGFNPFFSPDGNWIGYVEDGALKKMAVKGDKAFTICEGSIGRGSTWGTSDQIVFAGVWSGLSIVSATCGGVTTRAVHNTTTRTTERWST